MGLYGVAIGEEWGGAGLDYTALAVACEEIAAGDCATATIVAVNNLVAGILPATAMPRRKRNFCKPLAQGEMLGAFALTEPQVGSDACAITTRAERKGEHYVLNGVKQFITSGKNADIAVVFAVTDKDAGKKRHQRLPRADHDAGLHRGAHRGEDRAARFRHGADRVRELQGAGGASARAGRRRLSHRARQPRVGPHQRRRAGHRRGARRARRGARLRTRAQEHGQGADRAPGGQLPPRRHGDRRRGRRASSICTPRACATPASPASRKRRWPSCSPPRWPRSVCSDAIQIHGGYGYVADFPVERLWRDVRVTQIYEGASDIQRMVIGRTLEERADVGDQEPDQSPLGRVRANAERMQALVDD